MRQKDKKSSGPEKQENHTCKEIENTEANIASQSRNGLGRHSREKRLPVEDLIADIEIPNLASPTRVKEKL